MNNEITTAGAQVRGYDTVTWLSSKWLCWYASHSLVVDNPIRSVLWATLVGGQSNQASGAHSSVIGGKTNVASGAYSAIAGGSGNIASADYSFAAGLNSHAQGQYTVAIGAWKVVWIGALSYSTHLQSLVQDVEQTRAQQLLARWCWQMVKTQLRMGHPQMPFMLDSQADSICIRVLRRALVHHLQQGLGHGALCPM